ncbi:hypothetical protein KSF_075590 [Reticulibacter mediterranei]|uniref:Intracellular septation protein A n=1 Tax=Reticulibacter mediterranei TaxID=2778369 RepID=A0A8J3IMY6_9CHLR|nr:VC0807 family protein [Reticulibacter mediterranei]GHO97511.1 hypothetical protein KSF_075590 [Reticulibacter mediterranei]
MVNRQTHSSNNIHSFIRTMIRMLIVNAAIPYACYTILTANHVPVTTALLVAAVAPALESIGSIIRGRRLHVPSLFVMGSLLVGIVLTLMSGDPHVLLLRESIIFGLFGVVNFLSLLFPQPLMFLIGRSFIASSNQEQIEGYNTLWSNPHVHRTSRIVTIVWGFVCIGEFLLRVFMVSTLPLATVVAFGSLISHGVIVLAIIWTFAYGRRVRAHIRDENPITQQKNNQTSINQAANRQ